MIKFPVNGNVQYKAQFPIVGNSIGNRALYTAYFQENLMFAQYPDHVAMYTSKYA